MSAFGAVQSFTSLGLILAAFASAQEPDPVFRTTTRLVEISVTVKHPGGEPVPALVKEDFVVLADGQPRQVAFLQFDGVAATRTNAPQPLPRYVFTNRAEFLPSGSRNVVAIVLDTLNSAPADSVRVRAQLIEYLKSLPPGSRIALYHLGSRLRVLHDFTEDRETLRRRLASLAETRPVTAAEDLESLRAESRDLLDILGDSAALWQETLDRGLNAELYQANRIRAQRYEMTYASMLALARHLSAAPGRKSLVWAGGGLPAIQIVGHWAFGGHNSQINYMERVRTVSSRLAEANVVLYYYDTRGIVAPSHDAGAKNFRPPTDAERITADARIATTSLSEWTGGRYINASNDLATALEIAEADQRASYTLAFYADGERNSDWTPIRIKVNKPGLRVSHRTGYGTAAPVAKWDEQAVRAAIAAPVGRDSILLNARCEPNLSTSGRTLRLFVQIDAETLTFQGGPDEMTGSIEIAVAELDAEGRSFIHSETARLRLNRANWEKTLREGIPYMREWAAHPASVRVRVLVRDNTTGITGVLDIPLQSVLGN
jgi:VWFA-related protein